MTRLIALRDNSWLSAARARAYGGLKTVPPLRQGIALLQEALSRPRSNLVLLLVAVCAASEAARLLARHSCPGRGRFGKILEA